MLTLEKRPSSVLLFAVGIVFFAIGSEEALSQDPVYRGFTFVVSGGEAQIKAYREDFPKDVGIPSTLRADGNDYPVRRIRVSAFEGLQLTSVTIPSSVRRIDSAAFRNNKLTSVTIPNSVTSIQGSVFKNNELTSVFFSGNVTDIGSWAFQHNKLTSVIIPDSVTSIDYGAFQDNKLTSVIIPDSVTTIGENAFSGNLLEEVTIPDSMTSIGVGVFGGNRLQQVSIPDSVTSIGTRAFIDNQLTEITISDSVTTIGDRAFADNPLNKVSVPDSITSSGTRPFDWSENDNSVLTIRATHSQETDTSITIEPHAVLELQPESETLYVELERGCLWSRTSGISSDRVMIRTPVAVTARRGTVFMVEAEETHTDVTVMEGAVEVSTRDGSQNVLVEGDRWVRVTSAGIEGPYRILCDGLRIVKVWHEQDERPFLFLTTEHARDITSATVFGPDGIERDLSYCDDTNEWIWTQKYSNESVLNEDWPEGDYFVVFNDGEMSVTIPYTPQPFPEQAPVITYPAHGQAGVELTPTHTWESVADTGEKLLLTVIQMPGDEELYHESVDIAQTSWSPGQLEVDSDYSFSAQIVNTDPGSGNLPTQLDQTVEYWGAALKGSEVHFSTHADDESQPEDGFLAKARVFVQEADDAQPVTPDSYLFATELIWGELKWTPNEVSLIVGGDESYSMWEEEAGEWFLHSWHETKSDLDNAFPSETTYKYIYSGDPVGTEERQVELGPDAYPDDIPYFTGNVYTRTQTEFDVSSDFELSWNEFTPHAEAIFAFVEVLLLNVNTDEEIWWELPHDATSFTVPADTLVPDTPYEIEVLFGNVMSDEGQVVTVFLDWTVIEFNTTNVPLIDEIQLIKFTGHEDGQAIPDHENLMVLFVEGSGITGAKVQGPDGMERTIKWNDADDWVWTEDYENEAALDDDWPAGEYTFIFNDGVESVTVYYTPQSFPAQLLEITYPAHNQIGVDLNPTYTWEMLDEAGDALWLSVFEDPDDLDKQIHEEFPADISMTSWQPGPLAADTVHSFETAVVNLDPASGEVTTASGGTVEYTATARNFNMVEFTTKDTATHTLTYTAGPGGLIVGESPQTLNYGESGSTVGAFADTGAEFRKWSDGVTDNPRTDHNVTGDIEVTALFQSAGGVPIEWYDQYGLAPSGDEAWSDLDDYDEYDKGMTLREEYVADTIPTESTSVFRVVEMEVGPPVTITVDPSSPGRVYTLRYSEDLVNWRDVTDQIAVPGGTEPLTDPAHPESNHFHKVIVEVP